MEKYKLKDFAKWAKNERLSDGALHSALEEMERGLLGDRLGANLYKKRFLRLSKDEREQNVLRGELFPLTEG